MTRQIDKLARFATAALVCGWLLPGVALAIEEPMYGVLEQYGNIELRSYDEIVLAETVVDADFDAAGNQAFRRLFGYISGKNRSQVKIDMTAPVVQEAVSEKIAMTAPVVQKQDDRVGGWPSSFRISTTGTTRLYPPTRRSASGWSRSGRWQFCVSPAAGAARDSRPRRPNFEQSLADRGLDTRRPAVFARYDPPFKPWFLRRNEVMIPVTTESAPTTTDGGVRVVPFRPM